jgi:hypothetical protein
MAGKLNAYFGPIILQNDQLPEFIDSKKNQDFNEGNAEGFD